MKKLLESLDKEYKDLREINATGNIDGGAGPPKTPNAFSKSGEEDENDNAEVFDYKKDMHTKVHTSSKMKESKYKQMMKGLYEISYKEYKDDDTQTSHQKVNNSVKEINRMMFEIERVVKRAYKLKTENGVESGKYWKSTQSKFRKISERMLKVAKTMRDLNA